MDRQQVKEHNARRAAFLCKRHGCDEKLTQIHHDMIVNRAWNPHPSKEFVEWWQTQPDFIDQGIDAVRARNCKVYVDAYKDAVEVGLASLPTDYPR
jgi:hypothetical protein